MYIRKSEFSKSDKDCKLFYIYDANMCQQIDENLFRPQKLKNNNLLRSRTAGRGEVYFFDYNSYSYVLRHFRRGGWIKPIFEDRYLWTNLQSTRAWQEWHMLAELYQEGLPVPKPLAARVIKYRFTYKADIITQFLVEARSLYEVLVNEAISMDIWSEIGKCIRRFHDKGVYHADLNAYNIMLHPKGNISLLDFDRGRMRTPRKYWQRKNLKRLRQSLHKLQNEFLEFHFDKAWRILLEGYGS